MFSRVLKDIFELMRITLAPSGTQYTAIVNQEGMHTLLQFQKSHTNESFTNINDSNTHCKNATYMA